jgi:hypothetical protein
MTTVPSGLPILRGGPAVGRGRGVAPDVWSFFAALPPPVDALDAGQALQAGHPLATHPDVLAQTELRLDARSAVGPSGLSVDLHDPISERHIGRGARGGVRPALTPLARRCWRTCSAWR